MENLFKNTRANWVRYSKYELKEKDGVLYITPTNDATPDIYNIIKNSEEIVLDALNIGRLCMDKEKETEQQDAIMGFVSRYGLLGLITTITATASFMEYEVVHFNKNRFIKTETMDTLEYLAKFFPFEMPSVKKNGILFNWGIGGDTAMMALALTMDDRTTAVNMSFQRTYAEPYEWVKTQFIDWAFIFNTSVIYYDIKHGNEETRHLYQQAISIFDGKSPTYHIALFDKPTLVWNFNSLAIAIQMFFSMSLTDEKNPLRMCKHCAKIFIASRPSAVFCGPHCKNRYNVYKSRAKEKNN